MMNQSKSEQTASAPIRRPALLKPVEPLPDVTGLHGEKIPLLVTINEVIELVNALTERENERQERE